MGPDAMPVDISIGDVFVPGLLVLALTALLLTGLSARLLTGLGIYRLFAFRPLADLCLFAIWLGLLVRFAPFSGIFT